MSITTPKTLKAPTDTVLKLITIAWFGDRQRHTKENNLGLLINPDGKNTLYVRDNKNVWIKKDKLLENELKSDKDFCDANNVSIGNLALAGKDSDNLMICKYDEKTDMCVAQGFLELEKESRNLSTWIAKRGCI